MGYGDGHVEASDLEALEENGSDASPPGAGSPSEPASPALSAIRLKSNG